METMFDKLKTLQEILSRKYSLEKEINEIPKTIITKNEVLNRAKKSFIERNEHTDQVKTKIRRLNLELTDATKKREDFEKQMDLIKMHLVCILALLLMKLQMHGLPSQAQTTPLNHWLVIGHLFVETGM